MVQQSRPPAGGGNQPAARAPESFFPVERFGAVESVVPVTAGLSGASVYAVRTARGEFFLRLHGMASGGFAETLQAQKLAAEAGIAPGIVLVDEAARASVSAKAEGVPFSQALMRPDIRVQALRNLAETLRRLHGIQATGVATFDAELGRSVWAEQSRRPGFPAWALPLGGAIDAGCKALAADPRRVFSHNDVVPPNLLWDGSTTWMIDWERAALAHPYIDLAEFSIFTNLADDNAVALLGIQEDRPISMAERTTFLAIRDYARAFYGAVFLRLVPDLAAVEFAEREATSTLSECYGRMAAGELDPRMPHAQALLGAAILRQITT